MKIAFYCRVDGQGFGFVLPDEADKLREFFAEHQDKPALEKSIKRKATRSMKISILCYNIGKSCVLQMRNGGLLWENVHLRT